MENNNTENNEQMNNSTKLKKLKKFDRIRFKIPLNKFYENNMMLFIKRRIEMEGFMKKIGIPFQNSSIRSREIITLTAQFIRNSEIAFQIELLGMPYIKPIKRIFPVIYYKDIIEGPVKIPYDDDTSPSRGGSRKTNKKSKKSKKVKSRKMKK